MLRRLCLFIAGFLMVGALVATPVYAQGTGSDDILDDVCTGQTTDSPTCASRTDENPLTGSDGLLMKITRIIAIIAGIAAIFVIIISGLRYMTAGGDAQKAASARNALIGALVGLFIIAISSLIIIFVISRI